jgi:hypothetical protein
MFQAIETVLKRRRVNRNRAWILSLDKAQLLALILESDTGLDLQDCDGLVKLALWNDPEAPKDAEGQKDAIVQRIAEHLLPR